MMCRLIFVKAVKPVSMHFHLKRFAHTAQHSTEDQSHGWGCAYLESGRWQFYHSLTPVWEDKLDRFGECRYFLAHARSAYRNEGIVIENNMPFHDGLKVFIFNGELQGVRVREKGRIGAEKVFNFVKRFEHAGTRKAIEKGVNLLTQKSRYVRAMNFIIAQRDRAWLATSFNENSEYFQMHEKYDLGTHIIASSPYAEDSGWLPVPNRTIREIEFSDV